MKHSTLADMISTKRLHTVAPDETVRNACIKMSSANIGALPVVNDAGELIGMLSERDVIKRSVIVYRPSETTPVKQVMTPNPQWLPPEARPEEAFQIMIAGRFRHLPICEAGKMIGIVSIRDFNPPSQSILERMRGKTGKATVRI